MSIEDKIANAMLKIIETKFNVQVQGHLEEEKHNESFDSLRGKSESMHVLQGKGA